MVLRCVCAMQFSFGPCATLGTPACHPKAKNEDGAKIEPGSEDAKSTATSDFVTPQKTAKDEIGSQAGDEAMAPVVNYDESQQEPPPPTPAEAVGLWNSAAQDAAGEGPAKGEEKE